MRFIAALLVMSFWPLLARANLIDINTGEHAEFTRVVLNIPENADWRLGRRAEGYVLRIPQADGFNLDGFFDIIPRKRIKDVSQAVDGRELRLDVDCLCNVRAYLFRPDVLVIDVRDGPPTRISSFELTLALPPAPMSRGADRANTGIPYRISQNRFLPLFPVAERVDTPDDQEPLTQRNSVSEQVIEPTSSNGDIRGAIATLEQSIVNGLGDALTGGLLDSGLDGPQPTSADIANRLDQIVDETSGLPGVSTRTSVDQNAVTSAARPEQTQTGQTCLPDSYFDVASWGDARPFFDQLNTARRAIVPEFERVDEEAVVNLARLYVHFGFGQEAIQTMGIDQVKSQERQYLQALARLVDGDAPEQGLFDGQVSCQTPVALWAMLSARTLPFDAQVDTVAVLTTFRSLPRVLQDVLAVPLSERLLEIGETDGALQILGRTDDSFVAGSERVLANAALLDALGEGDEAVEVVSEAARTDPRTTPELMIRFFEDGIANGASFSDADFMLSDALLFEASGGVATVDLIAAQIKAYVSVGRFEAALMLLTQSAAQLGTVKENELQNHIYRNATLALGDVDFLRLVVTDETVALADDVRNAVADRLIGLGFPGAAQRFLVMPASEEDISTKGVAGARAAEPDPLLQTPAVGIAVPVQGVGETLVGPTAEQVRDQQFAKIVARLEQDGIGPLDPDMPLSSGRALLESAAKSRAALNELLDTFAAPDAF